MRRIVASTMMIAVLAVSPAVSMAAAAKKTAVASAVSQFDQGVAAYERGDYSTAYSLFRPLADQGNADAQFNLGIMYELGWGVPQDYAAAVSWYRKAAEHGNADAHYNLGLIYSKGEGVQQDYAAAASWFRKAAERGQVGGQYALALYYALGQGVPEDYVQAHKWFNLAAAKATDADVRDGALKYRDIVAAKMTPAQIAEAQRLASAWKVK